MQNPFDAIFGFLKAYDEGKKQLFDQHIEPLMKLMSEIHADYIVAFGEVRSSLVKQEVPNNELLEFLKSRRRQLADKRQFAKVLAEELGMAEQRVVRPQAWEDVKAFCDAVMEYFETSGSVASPSWFTDFISFMAVSRAAGMEKNFFDHNVFGNDPRSDTIRLIDQIVDKRLPYRMLKVQTAYARLRSALL